MIKRKIHTFFHNPRNVARKYGLILRFFIKRAPIPPYYEDYNAHWNHFSFRGKVVLDLGADYGSTAYFFGKKGASKVIAVEGDRGLFLRLQKYARRYHFIVPIQLMISSKEDLMQLIASYAPDIIKVDIEGAESLLSTFPRNYLAMVDEWLIETHGPRIASELCKTFSALGFQVKKIRQTEIQDILVIYEPTT